MVGAQPSPRRVREDECKKESRRVGELLRDCPPSVLASLSLSRRWLLPPGIPNLKPFPRLVAFTFLKDLVFRVQLQEEDSNALPASPIATPSVPFNNSSWPNVGRLASGFASVRGKESLQQPGESSQEPCKGMDSTSSAEVALLCAESTQTLRRAESGLPAPLLDWRITVNLSWLFLAQAQIIL